MRNDNAAMQALSDAGAQCGTCGDEPGDRNCPDCERCYQEYVKALRSAGWASRSEVLWEAKGVLAAHADRMDDCGMRREWREAARVLGHRADAAEGGDV
jgi:hypothetical protein